MAEGTPKIVTLDVLEYCMAQVKRKFVQAEPGKGLSTNDFTAELKAKLDGITIPGYEVATKEEVDAMLDEVFGSGTQDAGAGEGEVSGDGADLDETEDVGAGGGTDSGD